MSLKGDQSTGKWPRWLARGLSTLPAAWWLFIGIASGISERGPWTWESGIVVVMIILAVVVTAVAWWRAGAGGFLMILFGLAFSSFAYISAGRNEWLAVLVSGVPFLVAGIFFLVSWRQSQPSHNNAAGPMHPSL